MKKTIKRHKLYVTAEGYKQVFRPDNPMARDNGYVPEHRLIASKKIKRPLLPDEIVHHKDGNKLNNSPSNLVIVTKSEHREMHNKHKRKNNSDKKVK